MSDAYASVHIPKSLPIHGMALSSIGRKIEHNKVVVPHPNIQIDQLDFPRKVKVSWESPGHVLDMSLDNPFVLYFAGIGIFEGQEDNFTYSVPRPASSLDFSH